MMHHIGGDLKNVSTLFQPNILKTFSQIWETDYEICDVRGFHILNSAITFQSHFRIGPI